MERMRLSQCVKFTPHSIEDILRDTGHAMTGDSEGKEYRDQWGKSDKGMCDRFKDTRKIDEVGLSRIGDGMLRLEDEGIPKRKKMRTTFTGRQIFELEKMFETKKYLNAGERSHISR